MNPIGYASCIREDFKIRFRFCIIFRLHVGPLQQTLAEDC